MKFREYIQESFDTKPEKFTKHKKGPFAFYYRFAVEGVNYIVDIDKAGPAFWDVSFDVANKTSSFFKLTNNKQQFKVLRTVIATIQDFIQDHGDSIEKLYFVADKEDSKSRSSVYQRLVKKYIPQNFKLSISQTKQEDYDEFVLFNKDYKK